MDIEVEMLNTLELQLHVPTVHDHLLPMLTSLGAAPAYPDGDEPSRLVKWCECLTLIGVAQHHVAMFDSAVLARCVGTIGGLLSRGVADWVTGLDGTWKPGKASAKLTERVCFLNCAEDWECMKQLAVALEHALSEGREVILKCHPEFASMKEVKKVLKDVRSPRITSAHLKHEKVLEMLDTHYSVEHARKIHLFDERCHLKEDAKPANAKRAYLRGKNTDEETVTCIAGVTCTLARQLLEEAQRA